MLQKFIIKVKKMKIRKKDNIHPSPNTSSIMYYQNNQSLRRNSVQLYFRNYYVNGLCQMYTHSLFWSIRQYEILLNVPRSQYFDAKIVERLKELVTNHDYSDIFADNPELIENLAFSFYGGYSNNSTIYSSSFIQIDIESDNENIPNILEQIKDRIINTIGVIMNNYLAEIVDLIRNSIEPIITKESRIGIYQIFIDRIVFTPNDRSDMQLLLKLENELQEFNEKRKKCRTVKELKNIYNSLSVETRDLLIGIS